MLNTPHIRRPLAAMLVVLGGIMIFFATEAWAGVVLLALGVALEVAGIALKRKD